jgi:hypothetical protein
MYCTIVLLFFLRYLMDTENFISRWSVSWKKTGHAEMKYYWSPQQSHHNAKVLQ